MANPIILPSAVDVVVDWCRSVPAINDAYDGRISATMPRDERRVEYPWLTVQRVIGLPISPETAVDRVRVQFNSWGGLKSNSKYPGPNWGPADLGIRTLEAYIREFQQAYVASRNAVIEDMAGLEGIQQLTDPDSGGARFWMDAIALIRNA